MSQRLGAKKKRERGLMPWQDAMRGVLIIPEFYAILKEEGLPTSRRVDGSYWDDRSQRLWEEWNHDI